MSAQSQIEREEDQLSADLNAGRITREEFNRQMRELQRDYQEAAQDSARDAYERELQQW